MRLPRLIKKKMSLKFWKGDHYKNKIYNNYKYIYIYKFKKNGPRWARAPPRSIPTRKKVYFLRRDG